MFDLTALREKLTQDRYKQLVKLIDLVAAHAAVQMDLQQARFCLAQLHQIEMTLGDQSRFSDTIGIVTQSLFMNAIFHYTRAIHSKPTNRLRVNVENRFTTEQKMMHRTLTKLRDQCLAHYGRGALSADEFWVDDRVIYVPGEAEPIQYPFVRVHHQSLIDHGLMDLLDTAGPAIIEARAKLARQLVNEIEALRVSDSHFTDVLQQCGFDVVAFHGRAS